MVAYTEPTLPGWIHVHPEKAVNGLPDLGEPIDRIFVDSMFEDLEPELISLVAQSWFDHPGVSVKTLLAITGSKPGGSRLHACLRPVGWGIVHPYNLWYLATDGWPLLSTESTQYGALCRALKVEPPPAQTDQREV